jgi:glutamate---cysteine ligase / carboxylate-amine ligase
MISDGDAMLGLGSDTDIRSSTREHPTDGDPIWTASGLTVGVEEEFHVVDLDSRELVARGPQILDRLPAMSFTPELHRSVVETNTGVHTTLDALRADLVDLRTRAATVAESLGLGLAAAGTVPLVEQDDLTVTPTSRYERMLDDYQILAREQLICGAQVHVGLADRDLAVVVAQRVSRWLPILLAISASSPYWLGQDSGYASMRSLLWQRWPTAGASGLVQSAVDHDALVAELLSSGTISDQAMIYFDVRPSAHVPTVELRVTDACPDVDDVVLLAGLFRALVRRERAAAMAGRPLVPVRAPVLRAAMWRAARSGLEGDLVDLTDFARPVEARAAVLGLLDGLRDQLEEHDDWDQVAELAQRALRRGSAADWQRHVFARRGRMVDVVDAVLARTRTSDRSSTELDRRPQPLFAGYRAQVHGSGDEVITADGTIVTPYQPIVDLIERLGPAGLRQRQRDRDAEQRAGNMTFRVAGETKPQPFPFDLIPRIVPADDWRRLSAGLVQRARALDAFLHDVYKDRAVVADGVIPSWVIDGAPGLLPLAALVDQPVRAPVCGMDLVHDAAGTWHVLEDNLRMPSGLGYALANRRLSRHIWPDLQIPQDVLPVEGVPGLLASTLRAAAPPATQSSDPFVALLSEGPVDSAWFEHKLLAEEMDVPVIHTTDLVVRDHMVYLRRHGMRRRVDVLYLRMSEDDLVHASGADGRPLGPSLLSAVASGTVALANAPGNGIGDDKAVYAFVPAMIEYYLGEKPALAHVPTYLCGDPEQRAHVLEHLDELVVKPVDGYGGEGVVIGPNAADSELAVLDRQIRAAPHRWIAQETMQLSTHPVFDGSGLAPRHIDLRAFVLLGERAEVATAGLTRVAPEGSLIVNSSRGGGAKDTWILGSPGAMATIA